MKAYKRTIFYLFLIICTYSYSQERCFKILEINEIKYYYVYEALDLVSKDTVTVLSSKSDKEFKIIKLDKNNFYKVKTRLKSAIKISDEKYIFCKHAITILEDIQISNKNELPIMILDYEKVNECNK